MLDRHHAAALLVRISSCAAVASHWLPQRQPHDAFLPQNIAKNHFHTPELSGFAARNFEALLGDLEREDVQVILVRIPARRRYLTLAQQQPGGRAFFEAVDARVKATAESRGASIVDCPLPESCGLTSEAFTDYGHMNREGARAFTRWLHQQVRALERP